MTEHTPSTRAGLRDEIADALEAADYSGNMRRGDLADSVMPVLYREWPWLRAEAEELGQARAELQQHAEAESADAAAGSYAGRAERAEETVTRVTALYEQWVKAGPPPLGVSMSRWWDRRLVELHDAIQPAAEPEENR